MNLTNISHIVLAITFQIIIACVYIFFGLDTATSYLCGGLFSIGFYFGREVAQVEAKHNSNPWWIGFNFKLWSKDSLLDFICPTIACIIVYIVVLLVF